MRMVDKAIEFAANAHHGDMRKGTSTPYVTHPFAVGLLLAEAGCAEAVICAGILHDTVEDTDVQPEDLVREFGAEVAALVAGASEPDKDLSWRERKEHTHAFLRSASKDVCMVACADKLHNLRCQKRDLELKGPEAWDKFNSSRDDQQWYFEGILESLSATLAGESLFVQLQEEVRAVFSKY
jgi:(p)ppGpp synthase/HD superfamily hydrolase